jgi:putative ABC transport system permease protein
MGINFIYALRNLNKHATNSIISVAGLAIAVACCLWIFLFVKQEHSYDNFHKDADKIYRINYEESFVDGKDKDVRLEPEIAHLLMKKVPQVDKSTEYRSAFFQVLKFNNEFFDAEMSYTEKEFFDIFSFDLVAGKKDEIFLGPDEIVITRELAEKLQGEKYKTANDLLGETVEFPLTYGTKQFRITGILKNIPKNSSIHFEGIIPGENGQNFGGCDNDFGYTAIFYRIKENTSPADAERNTIALVNDYYQSRILQLKSNNEMINSPKAFVPFILPLKNVYLQKDLGNCFEKSSNPMYSAILITIGILILLIACCNYTILSLGQALKKTSDVGVRKALGARKGNIFAIFFSEGIILTFIAFILGALLCVLLFEKVSSITNAKIYTELINIPWIVAFVLISFLVIVLFTSIIPVLVFSNVSTNNLIGKRFNMGRKGLSSQLFVSFQYCLSIILIIVTLSVVRQYRYMKNKPVGFTSKNIVDIEIDRLDRAEQFLLRDKLREFPGVISLTLSDRNFLNGTSNSYINKGNGEQIIVYRYKVDEQYIPTLGLHLIHGRNFSIDNIRPGDGTIIVNNSFIKAFGIEDDPVGRTYNFFGNNCTVIGVVDDFNYRDLRHKLEPAMLFTRTNFGNDLNYILLKFRPDQLSDVMDHIKKTYQEVAPGKNITYHFWDEELGTWYEEEARWSKIVGYSSLIAILISSLGLFGLTILLINQRIKEIGIRKVNGARTVNILFALNKNFMNWLVISIVVATPASYYIIRKWLENYSYKTSISWWIFAIAGILAIGIALLTVSWQSYRAATRNPVEALRYE